MESNATFTSAVDLQSGGDDVVCIKKEGVCEEKAEGKWKWSVSKKGCRALEVGKGGGFGAWWGAGGMWELKWVKVMETGVKGLG